jgi:hypothetical protein
MSRVSVTPDGYAGLTGRIHRARPGRSPGEMRALREWLDEQWDVCTMVAALALALIVSTGLGLAYNIAATRIAPPAPTLESWPAAPSGSAPEIDYGTGVNRTASATA